MLSFPDLARLLVEHFGLDEASLRPEATFEELEMDSIALVELVVIVEETLGVRLPDTDVGLGLSSTLAEAAEVLAKAGLLPASPVRTAPETDERGIGPALRSGA